MKNGYQSEEDRMNNLALVKKSMNYLVKLRATGIPKSDTLCQTLQDCASELRKFVSEWNLGASDLKAGCGNIMQDGKMVAHVSYNGRIWQNGEPLDGLTASQWLNSDSGFIDIARFPFLPVSVAVVAGYAINFMAIHGIFNALSIIGR